MPETIQVLIVGGGGGGQAKAGGGGGGLIEWVSIAPVQSTNYSIVIGAGGAPGAKGGDTTAFGKMAMGGGFGAPYLGSGGPGGSGGGGEERFRGGNNPGGSGFYPGITINGVTFNTAIHVARQGYDGGYGFSNNQNYAGGQGGGYTSVGAGGYQLAGQGIYDNGYVTDANLRQVPPFNNTGGEVVTRIGIGGGYSTAYSGGSVVPIGAGKWYGNGGQPGGAGTQGIVVVRYAGTVSGTGGNHVTYNSNNDTSYHVFTSAGTLRFN